MSLVEKFNKVSSSVYLPTKKPFELVEEKIYIIIEMRWCDTKYGRSLVATIKDGEIAFNVFLPKRFSSVLSDEDLEVFKTKPHSIKFTNVKQRSPTVELAVIV